jgi:hypothetical protein
VKNIRIKLKYGQKTKEPLFICEPNIDESHTIIQSAVEQVRACTHAALRQGCQIILGA